VAVEGSKDAGVVPGAGGAARAADAAGADDDKVAAAGGIVERVSYLEIAKQFSLLGWTAFGGPAAHIGIMQKVWTDLFLPSSCCCCACCAPVLFPLSVLRPLSLHLNRPPTYTSHPFPPNPTASASSTSCTG